MESIAARSSAFVMRKWRILAFAMQKRTIVAAALLMGNLWFIYGNSCVIFIASRKNDGIPIIADIFLVFLCVPKKLYFCTAKSK